MISVKLAQLFHIPCTFHCTPCRSQQKLFNRTFQISKVTISLHVAVAMNVWVSFHLFVIWCSSGQNLQWIWKKLHNRLPRHSAVWSTEIWNSKWVIFGILLPIFTSWHYASVVHAAVICLSVWLSLCLCVCCVSVTRRYCVKTAELRITQQLHTIAQNVKFSDAKGESTGVQNLKSLALSILEIF